MVNNLSGRYLPPMATRDGPEGNPSRGNAASLIFKGLFNGEFGANRTGAIIMAHLWSAIAVSTGRIKIA